jgi:hypothetical protein
MTSDHRAWHDDINGLDVELLRTKFALKQTGRAGLKPADKDDAE